MSRNLKVLYESTTCETYKNLMDNNTSQKFQSCKKSKQSINHRGIQKVSLWASHKFYKTLQKSPAHIVDKYSAWLVLVQQNKLCVSFISWEKYKNMAPFYSLLRSCIIKWFFNNLNIIHSLPLIVLKVHRSWFWFFCLFQVSS